MYTYFKLLTEGHTLRSEVNPVLMSCFIVVSLKLILYTYNVMHNNVIEIISRVARPGNLMQ